MMGTIRRRNRKDETTLEIREAISADLSELMEFYDSMCQVLGQKSFLPDGNKGGFPSQEMVSVAIEQHNQFVGTEDGRIVAAYIMNHDCDPAYDLVTWQIQADRQEVMTLHALRVLPEYGGRGYSKKLVEHAIRTARNRHQKAIRLDCIEGNDIPQKMYQSFGFRYIDTVDITYADIGVPRKFLVFELVI